MKKLLYLITALTLFIFSCKKNKKGPVYPPETSLYMQVIRGSGQADTIGNRLPDSIVIKAIKNGSALSGYKVEFKRSGCQEQITSATVSASGQVSYAWYLSGEIGTQSLKIVLLDNSNARIDSMTVTASGIAPSSGWHRGGCLQNFPVNNVTALSSGRILASVNSKNYPFYSDDNAESWHPLSSFGSSYFVSKILSTSAGTILATQNDGIFLSDDNGQTWANISGGIWNVQEFSDVTYTASGKLIFTDSSGLFISTDKGQSWTEDDFGLPAGSATYPVELPNGNLFVIGSDNSVYMLQLHASTWESIGANGNYILSNVESLFVDNNGHIFTGTPHNAPDGMAYIYESVDGGSSWSPVFSQNLINPTSSYPNIDHMSQINGTYYFSYAGIGVYQTSNFNNFSQVTQQLGNIGLPTYTVGQNGIFILGSPGFGVYYRIP